MLRRFLQNDYICIPNESAYYHTDDSGLFRPAPWRFAHCFARELRRVRFLQRRPQGSLVGGRHRYDRSPDVGSHLRVRARYGGHRRSRNELYADGAGLLRGLSLHRLRAHPGVFPQEPRLHLPVSRRSLRSDDAQDRSLVLLHFQGLGGISAALPGVRDPAAYGIQPARTAIYPERSPEHTDSARLHLPRRYEIGALDRYAEDCMYGRVHSADHYIYCARAGTGLPWHGADGERQPLVPHLLL